MKDILYKTAPHTNLLSYYQSIKMSSMVGFLSCLISTAGATKSNEQPDETSNVDNLTNIMVCKVKNLIDSSVDIKTLNADLKRLDDSLKRLNSKMKDLISKLSSINRSTSNPPISRFYSSDIFDTNVLAVIKEFVVESASEVVEASRDKYIIDRYPDDDSSILELWYKNMAVGISNSKKTAWISIYDDKSAYYTATYIYRHYATCEFDMGEMEEYLRVRHVQEISCEDSHRSPSTIAAIRKQLTELKGTCVVYNGSDKFTLRYEWLPVSLVKINYGNYGGDVNEDGDKDPFDNIPFCDPSTVDPDEENDEEIIACRSTRICVTPLVRSEVKGDKSGFCYYDASSYSHRIEMYSTKGTESAKMGNIAAVRVIKTACIEDYPLRNMKFRDFQTIMCRYVKKT